MVKKKFILNIIGVLIILGIFPVLTAQPNYGKIVFISDRDNFGMQIYIMNADGSNPVRKTFTVSEYCKAIFLNGEVHIIENGMICDNCCPAWAPDGSKIAFTTGFGCHVLQVSILDLNENKIIDIPESIKASDSAAWSPDGTKIAFAAKTNNKSGIFLLDSTSSALIDLTEELPIGKEIAWSPDGKKFTFSSGMYTYVINVDGTNKKRLTTDGNNSSWSPDGKKIVFDSKRDGNEEIYVMNADGSNQKNLTNNPADDRFPDWCCQTLLEDRFPSSLMLIAVIFSIFILLLLISSITKKKLHKP